MKQVEFNENVYMQIGYDDLVTYALFSLIKKKNEPTFENLVVECFKLFPKRFSLIGYAMYPDSGLVNKSWLRCRTDKHLIEGSTAKGFKLTLEGIQVAEKVAYMLRDSSGTSLVNKIKGDERTRAGRFVTHMENSSVFHKYCQDPLNTQISEFEIRDFLLGTMQTEPRILRENLRKLQEYAKLYQHKDLIRFLERIDQKLHQMFNFDEKQIRYEGGMNKKKIRKYGREGTERF